MGLGLGKIVMGQMWEAVVLVSLSALCGSENDTRQLGARDYWGCECIWLLVETCRVLLICHLKELGAA